MRIDAVDALVNERASFRSEADHARNPPGQPVNLFNTPLVHVLMTENANGVERLFKWVGRLIRSSDIRLHALVNVSVTPKRSSSQTELKYAVFAENSRK